jgi:hypothetical protein
LFPNGGAFLCRSIGAVYTESIVYKGIHSFKYSAGFGDMSTDPELKCFCTSPDTCMKKGVHDLTRCSGNTFVSSCLSSIMQQSIFPFIHFRLNKFQFQTIFSATRVKFTLSETDRYHPIFNNLSRQ